MPSRPSPITHARAFLLGLGLLVALLAGCASAPQTGGGGRVALIVRHGDGQLETACVSYEGESISGEELLATSGFAVRLDAANAMGSLICSIDGEGCAFPEEPCLCQCDQPGACGYWAYFGWDPQRGAWTYAAQGARLRQLHDGDLDAWVWLTSTGPDAAMAAIPQDIAFEDVCQGP
jgi:hypothetical protein